LQTVHAELLDGFNTESVDKLNNLLALARKHGKTDVSEKLAARKDKCVSALSISFYGLRNDPLGKHLD
jgi:hypothetical protein